jgi:hypothetical protein
MNSDNIRKYKVGPSSDIIVEKNSFDILEYKGNLKNTSMDYNHNLGNNLSSTQSLNNKISNKLIKSFNIFKRFFNNNIGKFIIFIILFIFVIILVLNDVPLDGSYPEDATNSKKFLSLVNLILLSIIVTGILSIFNIENEISKENASTIKQFECRLATFTELLNYKYLYGPVNKEVIEILLVNGLIDEDEEFLDNSITKIKIIIKYALDKIQNDIDYFNIYISLLEDIRNLKNDNYDNLYKIKNTIQNKLNELHRYLNTIRIDLNNNPNLLYKYYKDNNTNKSVNKFLTVNNIDLEFINTIDNDYINKIFNMLKQTCSTNGQCN